MARRTHTFTVQSEGRDAGKAFLLTEMPAAQAERWAMRLGMAAMSQSIDIPDGTFDAGMAGIADMNCTVLQALASIPFEIAEPLLDEMMACVQILPNPAKPEIVRALYEGDIEEVATRFRLRKEVFLLHVGFSEAGDTSTSASASA